MGYAKIDRRIWSDEKFSTLSGPAKLLVFYLLTSPHNMLLPGVIRISEEGVAADLGWSLEQCRERFSELYAIRFVRNYSRYSHYMYMPNGIRYNFPPNENVIKGWEKYFWELPEPLKSDVMQAFRQTIETTKPKLLNAFDTVSKPLVNRVGLQEQEQEQYQEQYYEQQTVPRSASDAKAAADWLCEQLSVAGKDIRSLFAEVIEQERRNGTDEVQLIAENMLRTRRNYEALFTKNGFVWPVKAFFAQAIWKQPNQWKGNAKRTIAEAVQNFDAADV